MPSGVKRPIDLEIGCGVGMHAIQYAKANPSRTIIALDRSRMRLGKMKLALEQEKDIRNLVMICEDADKFVVHEIQDNSVAHLFFLYPNPYPKARQANKRWHQMPLMECFLQKLTKGGMIHLATNKKYYADEAADFFVREWKLTMHAQSQFQGEMPFAPRTHFEKKYLERGDVLYDFIFIKRY